MQKNFVGGVVYAFAPYGRNMVETAFIRLVTLLQDSMNAVLYLTHKKLQYGMNANSTTRISCVRIHADIEPLFADFLLTLCYD